MSEIEYIQKCFALAKQGLGATWPNPMVGAVLVKDGRIIGEGHHTKYGEDHAELAAFKNCQVSPEGATLYVNLEPCCHTKKQTPPCAQRIIQEKIKKVVISNLDPNPLVNGEGVKLLRSHGIEVKHGVLAEEGERLNEVFFHAQRQLRPFIYLKLASSLDGRIALPSGESKWITGQRARQHVHEMRAQHQAIMVGANTLRKDNPQLTVRVPDFQGQPPYRVVFTKSGELPLHFGLFTDELKEKTIVYTKGKVPQLKGPQVIKIGTLHEALQDLFEKKLINLFLEGGASLATNFLQEGLIDRVGLYLNPSFLGAGPTALADFGLSQISLRPKLLDVQSEWLDGDLFLTGTIKKEQ